MQHARHHPARHGRRARSPLNAGTPLGRNAYLETAPGGPSRAPAPSAGTHLGLLRVAQENAVYIVLLLALGVLAVTIFALDGIGMGPRHRAARARLSGRPERRGS
jgi:hypothetical protein